MAIKAEIYDFDNTLYPDPADKNKHFLQAAVLTACQLVTNLGAQEAQALASQSFKETGSEMTVFIREYGISETDFHQCYHGHAFDLIFQDARPDETLTGHFNDRRRLAIPTAIVTHGSAEWLLKGLKKLGLGDSFDPHLLFALDHPEIQYSRKDSSAHPFLIASNAMGVTVSETRVFEDHAPNLVIPHSLGAETILVSWDAPTPTQPGHVHRVVRRVSEYKI